MFLKYPIICSHVYCYSNKAQPPPSPEIVQAAQYGLDSSYLSSCEDDLLIICQVAISCTHFSVPILLAIHNNLIFSFLSLQNSNND
jgi:hypothetical protein